LDIRLQRDAGRAMKIPKRIPRAAFIRAITAFRILDSPFPLFFFFF